MYKKEKFIVTNRNQGFTLLELLVTIAIVGILAAIALPKFSEYRTRGYNSNALSVLRNSVTSQEAFYVDNNEYAPCVSPFTCELALPGLKLPTSGGEYLINPIRHDVSLGGDSFTAFANHVKGDKTARFDSDDGVAYLD